VVERAGVVPKGVHKAADFFTNEFNPYASEAVN
jgi:hypothetical protein